MDQPLNAIEIRVLGALLEKEMTTPEYYPLSLNGLTNACNQKSNRDPVMALEETDVVRALDALRHRGLALQAASDGGRVPKYKHNLAQKLYLEPEEAAILCELLLRGPQTVGELRGRADRMQAMPSLEAVEAALDALAGRDEPLVVKLPRQSGRKESRYAHLLGEAPAIEECAAELPPEAARRQVIAENERIAALEETVATLRREVDLIKEEFALFRSQFD